MRKNSTGSNRIPHLVTHDVHTIWYPDPLSKINETIQIDLETGKMIDFIIWHWVKWLEVLTWEELVWPRILVLLVRFKDANVSSFVTQLSNIFVIYRDNTPWIFLPQGKDIHLPIAKENNRKLIAKQSSRWNYLEVIKSVESLYLINDNTASHS